MGRCRPSQHPIARVISRRRAIGSAGCPAQRSRPTICLRDALASGFAVSPVDHLQVVPPVARRLASCHRPSNELCPSLAEKRWSNPEASRQKRNTSPLSDTP
jgi:hypothetical protein